MPIGAAQVTNSDFGRGGPVAPTAAVPFQNRIDPKSLSTYLTMQQHEQMRLRRYAEHWNFYFGKQWAFTREDGEPLVTLNYFRKILDKSVSFLFGKGVTYTVPQALEQVTLPFIEKIWKENNEAELQFEIGQMGAVTGDVFLLYTFEAPTPQQLRINPFTQGQVRINLLGSEQVFPTWDPQDTKKMISVRIETVVLDPSTGQIPATGERENPAGSRSLPGYLRYTQVITADTITKTGPDTAGQAVVTKNILGEIPIVHIKNLPLASEYYGLPDGQDLIDLQRELNEKSTDISDVVNYHAAPTTVITGAKAKDLARGPRKLWSGLPDTAKVYNLEYNGDMQISQLHWKNIKTALHEISDVPEKSLGGEQAISNTSGVALSMLYRPLIEKTEKKKSTYGPGLEKGNYFILRLGLLSGLLNVKFDLCKACGGRIIEREITVPGSKGADGKEITRLKKSCYHIDPQELDFIDPQEFRLKFLQKYAEGKQRRETEFWKILAQYRGLEKSYWQPDEKPEPQPKVTPEQRQEHGEATAEAQAAQERDPEGKPIGTPVPPPLPSGDVKTEEEQEFEQRTTEVGKTEEPDADKLELPPEPEEVTFTPVEYDPQSGQATRGAKQTRWLVPTECKVNQYLNPFETECNFGEPLPRDESLAADLYTKYLKLKVVSRKWVQRQIPAIQKELTQIEKEIEEEEPIAVDDPEAKQPENKTPEDTQKEQQNKTGKSPQEE